MCPQLFFFLIEKPPFAAPSGALKAPILELWFIVWPNLERRGAAARRGRRGGADRFEISGKKTAFLFDGLEHPNLGSCAMPQHQLPAPRRGRLPRPPWWPARGRLRSLQGEIFIHFYR